MTQVWMLRNSDTDIHVFNREAHIEPSIRITYSKCADLDIASEYDRSFHKLTYTVMGKRNGETFKDVLVFYRLPIWTEPSHL